MIALAYYLAIFAGSMSSLTQSRLLCENGIDEHCKNYFLAAIKRKLYLTVNG